MSETHKDDKLYKLSKGSYTARWAHDEIVNQDNKIAELQAQNAKLQQERDAILALAKAYAFGEEPPESSKTILNLVLKANSLQASRDLEQQAKGVEDSIKATVSGKYRLALREVCELYNYAFELRNQAKGESND